MVPLLRPVFVNDVADVVSESVVQPVVIAAFVQVFSDMLTRGAAAVDAPFVQETVDWALPWVGVTPVAAAGGAIGVTPEVAEPLAVPLSLIERRRKKYSVPLLRPVFVKLVTAFDAMVSSVQPVVIAAFVHVWTLRVSTGAALVDVTAVQVSATCVLPTVALGVDGVAGTS